MLDPEAEAVAAGLEQAAESAANNGNTSAANAFAEAAATIRDNDLSGPQAEAVAADVNASVSDEGDDGDDGDGDGGDGDGGGGD